MYAPTKLRTERLLLRPFAPDDVNDVFSYASDPEWSQFLPVPSPYKREDAQDFVDGNTNSNWQRNAMFAIEFNGAVVGGIDLRIDSPNSTAMVGYAIARAHWNKGLMTEAVQAVVDWGFAEFGLEKVYSWADVQNIGSWRVMEKIGMIREGTLRSHGILRGVRQDYHYYGILRDEWERKRE